MRFRRLLVFPLGVILGLLARGLIYAEGDLSRLWWAFLIGLTLAVGMLIGKFRAKRQGYPAERSQWRPQENMRAPAPETASPNRPAQDGIGAKRHEGAGIPPEPAAARAVEFDYTRNRRVKLTKVSGRATGAPRVPIIGFEAAPPEKGREYRILTDRGEIYCTQPVIKVAPGYIQTQDAFYELRVIEG